ncbi:hypothetical protein GH811_17235 [Acetobacterium malicum]|uniref:Uncharacterized protein n=1 Tax=Acetobacterium malicum TaxID=52692 RepID=A0ABR6Z1K4_9FIRM|nr:hypothetical protein [Acetobacterium malicum]MBC3901352.1 hypothetical protein [Acetobacterium malicum]
MDQNQRQQRSARTQVMVHTAIELTRSGSIENSADALENCYVKLKSDFQDKDGINKEKQVKKCVEL